MLILLLSSSRTCFPGKERKTESMFQENTWHISLQDTLHRTATSSWRKLTLALGDDVLWWAWWCWVIGCTLWSQRSFLTLTIWWFYNAARNARWWIPDSGQEVWIGSLVVRSPTYAWTTGLWHSGKKRKMWAWNPSGWEGPRNKASYFLDSSANYLLVYYI